MENTPLPQSSVLLNSVTPEADAEIVRVIDGMTVKLLFADTENKEVIPLSKKMMATSFANRRLLENE
jgi:hypothetical protein